MPAEVLGSQRSSDGRHVSLSLALPFKSITSVSGVRLFVTTLDGTALWRKDSALNSSNYFAAQQTIQREYIYFLLYSKRANEISLLQSWPEAILQSNKWYDLLGLGGSPCNQIFGKQGWQHMEHIWNLKRHKRKPIFLVHKTWHGTLDHLGQTVIRRTCCLSKQSKRNKRGGRPLLSTGWTLICSKQQKNGKNGKKKKNTHEILAEKMVNTSGIPSCYATMSPEGPHRRQPDLE